MKKQLFTLIIFFLTLTLCFAQTDIYYSFPTSNAFWGDDGGNLFNTNLCYNTRYGIIGDTLIDGISYKKIFSLYDSTLTNPQSKYYVSIREENKKIYTVIGNHPETLLYDFNLQAGDTINYNYSLSFNQTDSFSRFVDKVDTVLLKDGKYRKRWIFIPLSNPPNYSTVDTVIEGIGSICGIGLLNPLKNAWATNGDYFKFICFKQNDTVFYLNNPNCDHCFCKLLTSMNEIHEQLKINIFPNPFSEITTLKCDIYFTDATLYIYNLLGQQLSQIHEINGNSFTFNRMNLKSGLYFIQMQQNNKNILTDKIMITDK